VATKGVKGELLAALMRRTKKQKREWLRSKARDD
jgi:hypothetical protein